jgi:hypothetical protein
VRGEGVILLSRFDYAGRVDFDNEDRDTEDTDQDGAHGPVTAQRPRDKSPEL